MFKHDKDVRFCGYLIDWDFVSHGQLCGMWPILSFEAVSLIKDLFDANNGGTATTVRAGYIESAHVINHHNRGLHTVLRRFATVLSAQYAKIPPLAPDDLEDFEEERQLPSGH